MELRVRVYLRIGDFAEFLGAAGSLGAALVLALGLGFAPGLRGGALRGGIVLESVEK